MYFKEIKKSLKSEFNNFFDKIIKVDNHSSKETSSEARNKINPKVFIEINNAINEVIYKTHNQNNLWKGYRVLSIDESDIKIPNTEALKDEYRQNESENEITVKAKVGCIFNVVNNIILSSKIDNCKVSKQHMAKEMISEILKKSKENDLILFGKGYYSKELLSFLKENNVNFLLRLSEKDIKEMTIMNKSDQIIPIDYNQKFCKVRVLRFKVSASEEEILITNLSKKKLRIQNFMELFYMRWGKEITYNELRNRVIIENFTGTTKITIEQDFYAMIYLFNMIEMTERRCGYHRDSLNIVSRNKQKINFNITIGVLKEKLIEVMLEKSETKRSIMFKEIILQIKREVLLKQNVDNPWDKEEVKYFKN